MEYIKLNELCEINIGKTPSRNKNEYWGKGFNWLSISDLKESRLSETREEITDIAVKECNMRLVPKNTVVMSFKLSIGKTAILDKDMYTNEAIANFPIKNKEKLLPEYLFYALKTVNFNNTDRAVMGATLNKAKLNEIKIPYCDIEIQKRIINLLDKSQELIDKRKEQIEALDELVKSKFIEMFGNVNINDKEWNVTTMDKLIDVIGGYAFRSTEFVDVGIPVLKIGNINAGYFKSTNLMFWQKDDKLEKYLIKPGDLVISLTGTVGKEDYGNVCIMGDDYDEYYLNQRNAKLEIKSNELLNKYYLTYLLKVPEIKKRLTGISRGVRQANIANKDILNLEIPNPPIEIQNKFENFVKQVDKLKVEMEKSLKELEDNFNSLMQRAFKGELF
ncbi:restriction endonuclease subunit S [uncultured Clostridium sp.]|uniref:restriction endonuclease subunit S n=1 Tax=uncultured Clostridium sp. TaxID=59620 RepID=UPI00280BC53B|nr:restriction endonuclease subunit S [uncultured Clostridium sp.]